MFTSYYTDTDIWIFLSYQYQYAHIVTLKSYQLFSGFCFWYQYMVLVSGICETPLSRKSCFFQILKWDRLKSKLCLPTQQYFNPAPYCYIHYIYLSLNTLRQQGAGLRYYWIRNNDFNFSLPLNPFCSGGCRSVYSLGGGQFDPHFLTAPRGLIGP